MAAGAEFFLFGIEKENNAMRYRLNHLGGLGSVTGSCHLFRANGLSILVDCGLAQGRDRVVPMDQWPVAPGDIDYLFLTHAHIDHIGRIPDLIDAGFSGEIICTLPTLELLIPMLEDAMGFSGRSDDAVEKMKKRLEDLAWDFEYGICFDLKNGVSFTLGNAGHILGSCFIRFESSDPKWSVVFSGDLGPKDTPILPDPDIPDPCDLLIMESTYGDRVHGDRNERVRHLAEVLLHALADGGKVFIPSFALGRCQELIYEMDRIFAGEAFGKPVPVFLDSPLGLELTRVYARLDAFWDGPARQLLAMGDHPIDFKGLYGVESHRSHRRLLELPGPCIVIAGSGMVTGGRIVNHLAEGLGDRRNDVLFVGYQAVGTPGREILGCAGKRGGTVRLDGRDVNVRARVHQLTGYSAHADQVDLVDWVGAMERPPGKILLVHGESRAKEALYRALFP